MMARRVILESPVRIVVEHRKALSLDDDQASAHPLVRGHRTNSVKQLQVVVIAAKRGANCA